MKKFKDFKIFSYNANMSEVDTETTDYLLEMAIEL